MWPIANGFSSTRSVAQAAKREPSRPSLEDPRHVTIVAPLVIGRSAVRIIVAFLTVALGIALALTGSGHARDVLEAIRRLPPF